MQLVETSLAVGQVAFAAGLEAHPGWLHITDVAVRNGLLSLSVLLEAEDDVGQGRVLRQAIHSLLACKPTFPFNGGF